MPTPDVPASTTASTTAPAAGPTAGSGDRTGLDQCSSRDLAILDMLARNHTRTAVAEALSCSVATVDRRLDLLRRRLGVQTTIEVVVAAVRRGLV